MKKQIILIYILLGPLMVLITSIAGCKKWVQIPAPSTSISQGNVFATDPTAIGVLTSQYAQLASNSVLISSAASINSASCMGGFSSDELVPGAFANTNSLSVYLNHQTSQTTTDLWSSVYPAIFQVNSAIEGITKSTTTTPSIKKELLGEAYFLRSFYYFYLTNFYGDVPLITGTDPKVNSDMGRTVVETVYQQMIADLIQARSLLSKTYFDGTLLNTSNERVRPNYWAATALLARVYLYHKNYDKAVSTSSELITATSVFSLSTLDNAFLRAGLGNNEAIWQLQDVSSNVGTSEGQAFIILTGAVPQVYLSNNLLNAFEPGDLRATHWISSVNQGGSIYYFPYKYKELSISGTAMEYSTVFRLGEQYLIRAEAEAYGAGSGVSGAISDLNTIRNRAGLPNTTSTTQSDVLTAILHERQVELFTEWGHRWFDLVRTGQANTVMGGATGVTTQKGGNWMSTDQLYPIPISVLLANPALKQNPGYQ